MYKNELDRLKITGLSEQEAYHLICLSCDHYTTMKQYEEVIKTLLTKKGIIHEFYKIYYELHTIGMIGTSFSKEINDMFNNKKNKCLKILNIKS